MTTWQQNVCPIRARAIAGSIGRRLMRVCLPLMVLMAGIPSLSAVPVDEDYVVQPSADAAERAAQNANAATPDPVLPGATMVLVYGLLFVGGGYVLWRNFLRGRGKLPGGLRGGIEISQSRPMGNRQYLFVAKVGGKRMLLGAGPGFISHLAELPPEEDDETPTKQDDDVVRDLPSGGSSFGNLISRINERVGRPGDPPQQ